jgi:hypothetical protein
LSIPHPDCRRRSGVLNWGKGKAGSIKRVKRSESGESDSNDDDSADAENGDGGKKKLKRRRNGSEEDDWNPEDSDDVTHRESQAQVDGRPPLGSKGYQVNPDI